MSGTRFLDYVRAVQGHPAIVRGLPDDLAMSMPTPGRPVEGQLESVVFVTYRLVGLPPNLPDVYGPFHRVTAAWPDGDVIRIEDPPRSHSGAGWHTRLLGTPPPMPFTMAEYRAAEDALYALYDVVVPIYVKRGYMRPGVANRFDELFQTVGRASVLMDVYRGLNPEFYDWLGYP